MIPIGISSLFNFKVKQKLLSASSIPDNQLESLSGVESIPRIGTLVLIFKFNQLINLWKASIFGVLKQPFINKTTFNSTSNFLNIIQPVLPLDLIYMLPPSTTNIIFLANSRSLISKVQKILELMLLIENQSMLVIRLTSQKLYLNKKESYSFLCYRLQLQQSSLGTV